MQHAYPRLRRLLGSAALSVGLLTGLVPVASAQWVEQNTNFPVASTGVRDVEVVSNTTVWVTGRDGSRPIVPYNDFSRTIDGGATWMPGTVAPAAGKGFSNLNALSGTRAWATMIVDTIGGGELYKTTNGGTTWTRQLATGFPLASGGYLNAVRMFTLNNGVVMGDPLTTTTEFEVYTTTDGGTNWTPVPAASLPNPLTGEYGFQGLLVTQGTTDAWFGTNKGRIYHSTNGGTSWTVATTGLTSINQMAFSSPTHGLAMQLDANNNLTGTARTTNGGTTWTLITPTGTVYTSDLQAVPGATTTYITAGARTGNSGSAVSTDGGSTWTDMENGVQRTAIGAADVTHVWAGSFTDAAGTGGIFLGDLTPAPPAPIVTPDWVWVRGPGNSNQDDVGSGTATDAAGNVYVVGRFTGTAPFGTTTLTSAGDFDGYLAKYDPQGGFIWAQQFGGTAADIARDVTVDATGNVYVAGRFAATAAFGTQSVTSVGDADAFLAKYNAAGVVQWVRAGGGGDFDVAYQVATDGAGNVYMVGGFGGPLDPDATFGSISLFGQGGSDAFLVSYTSAGVLRWARDGGGASNEIATGLGVTSAGVVTIAGPFGTSNPGGGGTATFGSTTLTSAGGTDGFVVSYTNAGVVRWVRQFGGSADDGPNSIASDAAGNSYLCGYTLGSVTFSGATVTTTGTYSVLVISYSAAGTERWVQSGGGDTTASAYQLTTDAAGDAYVTGFFQGPAVFGTVTLPTVTAADAMVVKYEGATGTVQWGTSISGDDNEFGRGITVDGTGNIYVAGSTASLELRFANSTMTRARIGGFDGFLAKLGSPCTLAAPAVTASGPICVGQTLTLTATNVAIGTTLRWTGPNGFTASTLMPSIPNATAAASGVYILTVTSAAQGCSVTANVTATVNATPAAPVATGAFSRCGTGTLALGVTPTASATYRWYTTATGGTPIAGATGATYTTPSIATTTTYYVSTVAAGGCEGPRLAVAATIGAAPSVTLTAGGPTAFCAGGSVTLTAAGSAGATYQFALNGTALPGAIGATYSATQSGTYTVVATTGPTCTTTSTTVSVTVSPAAVATFTYTQTGGGLCTGAATPAAAVLAPGAAAGTFSATPAGLSLNATTGEINLTTSTPGTYTVSNLIAATGTCPAVTATTSVSVTATPAAPTVTAVPQGPLVLLTSSAPTGNQWYLNGVAISGAINPMYLVTAAAQNGTYTVITTAGPCASAPSTGRPVTVTGTAADLAAAAGLMLYPNPTTDGRVTLELAAAPVPTVITILDAAGRVVLRRPLPAGTTHVELDARALSAGVYAVRVGAAVRRLVRQ